MSVLPLHLPTYSKNWHFSFFFPLVKTKKFPFFHLRLTPTYLKLTFVSFSFFFFYEPFPNLPLKSLKKSCTCFSLIFLWQLWSACPLRLCPNLIVRQDWPCDICDQLLISFWIADWSISILSFDQYFVLFIISLWTFPIFKIFQVLLYAVIARYIWFHLKDDYCDDHLNENGDDDHLNCCQDDNWW